MTMLFCKMDSNTNISGEYESDHERSRPKLNEPESLQDKTLTCHPQLVTENDSPRNHSDSGNATRSNAKYNRRSCKFLNCSRVVKSQGLCQRHGARTKLCKAIGCQKQAQGGFEGFCKLHFKRKAFELSVLDVPSKESTIHVVNKEQIYPQIISSANPEIIISANPEIIISANPSLYKIQSNIQDQIEISSVFQTQSQNLYAKHLINNLEAGFSKQYPSGWYRRHQRLSRNVRALFDENMPLEAWELEMISNETKIINSKGGHSLFLYFAHAWGQEYGFHIKIAQLHRTRNTAFDIDDQGSEAARFQYGNQSIKDNNASRESLEASYEAFLAESKDSGTQSWF